MDIDGHSGTALPSHGLTQLTHFIYALHAFSALMGLIGSAFVLTAFLTGWPSIIAVVLNYLKRGDVRGTLVESHFSWQIRTFWFAVLWAAVAMVIAVTVVGLPLAWLMAVLLGVWVLYRIARGWLALSAGRTMPMA